MISNKNFFYYTTNTTRSERYSIDHLLYLTLFFHSHHFLLVESQYLFLLLLPRHVLFLFILNLTHKRRHVFFAVTEKHLPDTPKTSTSQWTLTGWRHHPNSHTAKEEVRRSELGQNGRMGSTGTGQNWTRKKRRREKEKSEVIKAKKGKKRKGKRIQGEERWDSVGWEGLELERLGLRKDGLGEAWAGRETWWGRRIGKGAVYFPGPRNGLSNSVLRQIELSPWRIWH